MSLQHSFDFNNLFGRLLRSKRFVKASSNALNALVAASIVFSLFSAPGQALAAARPVEQNEGENSTAGFPVPQDENIASPAGIADNSLLKLQASGELTTTFSLDNESLPTLTITKMPEDVIRTTPMIATVGGYLAISMGRRGA